LKARSPSGGAVLIALRGATAARLTEHLSNVRDASRVTIVKEENGEIWARICPRMNGSPPRNGEFIRNVLEATNGWRVEEIHIDEGRLDEVFRSITVPEAPPGKQSNPRNSEMANET
jgi:ABC-2 type transport system ATP-binding protein